MRATSVQLAAGAYASPASGLAEKICENMFLEETPVDPKRPVALVGIPGSLRRMTAAANIRGVFQADGHADGKVLIPAGTVVRTFDPATNTAGSLTGSIAGTDICDFAVGQTEAAFLANGSVYISTGSAVAIASDGDFPTNITSIDSIGQRLLMSAADGKLWFTSALDFDDITALNYYTAELFPDDLVAVRVFGSDILLFGTKTIEFWQQTGDSDDPFAWQNGRAIRVGALCRDGIANLDGIPYFVAHDRTVRRIRDGANAEIVSNAGVARALRSVAASDVKAATYSADNHVFYVLRLPEVTFVYDVATGEWHTRKTLGSDTWRWGHIVEAAGRHFIGEYGGTAFCEMSRDWISEDKTDADTMGTEIVREATGYLSVLEGEPEIASVRIEGSRGIGLDEGQGSDPQIMIEVSKPGDPNTFGPVRMRSLGLKGERAKRCIARMFGRARPPGAVIKVRVSDPVDWILTGVVVNGD